MSNASRGRLHDPRPNTAAPSVNRRPSPALAARIKMLEADAEKRNSHCNGTTIIVNRLSPSPSPHRSLSRTRDSSVSATSDCESPIEIPTSISTTNGALRLEKELPPTPVNEDDESGGVLLLPETTGAFKETSATNVPDPFFDKPHTPTTPTHNNTNTNNNNNNNSSSSSSSNDDRTFSSSSLSSNTLTHESHGLPTNMPSVSDLNDNNNSSSSPYSSSYSSGGATATTTTVASVVSAATLLARRGSVFSLSRVSFSAQLSRLTSLSLPLSDDLSSRIRHLSTAQEACTAINSAGKQIGRWIDTAKKVLSGLDAEDDVEWAAQGRESLNEVDAAINTFSGLINVYVSLVDELNSRPDIEDVDKNTMLEIVSCMEMTVEGWKEVQVLLGGVKDQVETAMEWTELWTTILQDIQAELEACQTLVFEMEERRHRSLMEEGNGSVDLETLETIMEDNPLSPLPTPVGMPGKDANEDSHLLGLFARMQPLRASLDFLPMRLASFQSRAESIFPSASEDLEIRRNTLEKKWQKLNRDAESLKKELGEDRWVTIFRNAGRQAGKMIESVDRSLSKLKEAIVAWEESNGRADRDLGKKIESYEAKKMHYGTAIQRFLAIIDKGVKDRLTVNGEILRLHSALHGRWKTTEAGMNDLDQVLSDLQLNSQMLRDSISSITSLDVYSHGGSGVYTPGSSPASSVNLTPSPNAADKRSPASTIRRPGSSGGNSPSSIPKKSPYSFASRYASTPAVSRSNHHSTGVFYQNYSSTPSPTTNRRTSSIPTVKDNRPRWNTSTNTNDGSLQLYKPLSLTTSSPHVKPTQRRGSTPSSGSRLPIPSPLSQANTPTAPTSPLHSPSSSRRGSSSLVTPSPSGRALRHQASISNLAFARKSSDESIDNYTSSGKSERERPGSRTNGRAPSRSNGGGGSSSSGGRTVSRSNGHPAANHNNYGYNTASGENGPKINVRPASAMASSGYAYRASALPRPKTPTGGAKRSSMPYGGNAEMRGIGDVDGKPRWKVGH